MDKVDVAGLKINTLSKPALLSLILQKIKTNQKLWITTPYSEFLFAGLKNPAMMELLNSSNIAVADGIGIFWAKRFLSLPLTTKTFLGKILQTLWQVLYSLLAIIFNRPWILNSLLTPSPSEEREGERLQEKIPGSELIWDIASLASENNLSLYLLGGFTNTSEIVANKLKQFTSSNYDGRHNLMIAEFSNKNPNDKSILSDIQTTKPDILLVAYGPLKQEQWILEHKNQLPSVKLFIGVGGSFDYIAGIKPNPPKRIRQIGLEWLWRLFTQPYRIKRIFNATFGLINLLVHYKVFTALPLRPNAAVVILNANNQILICERNIHNREVDIISTQEALMQKNYWQFPQGGIDQSEDIITSAKREAREETGLTDLQTLYTSPHTHTYLWNNALRKFWKNNRHKNRGQIQNLVYFRHLGLDTEVKVDNHEFSAYQWANINTLNTTIHPERKTLTDIVLNDLKELQEKGIIKLL